MKPSRHQQRHNADEDFHKSLAQLEDILQEKSAESVVAAEDNQPQEADVSSSVDTGLSDLAAWEDAVADIEKYLEQKNQQS
jgi:hypothetical protein